MILICIYTFYHKKIELLYYNLGPRIFYRTIGLLSAKHVTKLAFIRKHLSHLVDFKNVRFSKNDAKFAPSFQFRPNKAY